MIDRNNKVRLGDKMKDIGMDIDIHIEYRDKVGDNDAIFDIMKDPDAIGIIQEGIKGQIMDIYHDVTVTCTVSNVSMA